MKKLFLVLLAAVMLVSSAAYAEQDISDTPILGNSITTGLPTTHDNNIMVVQMDNEYKARPQKGIASADIVYEIEVYNGGYTRYTVVFNDTIPETVEAVRSARIVNIDTYLEYGGCFVHFGGQQYDGSNVFDYIKKVNVQERYDGWSGSPCFYRDNERKAPNNVVSELQKIYDRVDWSKITVSSPFTFGDEYTIEGDDVTEFSVNYRDSYCPSYTYNADDGLYYRSYNDKPHLDGDTEEQLTCSNVIVQYMSYSWYEGESDRPKVATTGTNKCEYFIGGKHFTGYWERAKTSENTVYYDEDGNEVVFKPGKTYVQTLKDTKEVTIAE